MGFADDSFDMKCHVLEGYGWWGIDEQGNLVKNGITEPLIRPLVKNDSITMVLDVKRQWMAVWINEARIAIVQDVRARTPCLSVGQDDGSR
jgi:hypothetical protein